MKKTILIASLLLSVSSIGLAQDDLKAVRATLTDYMEGTSKGQIARIKRAFTTNAALYSVNPDGTEKRLPIATYIGYFKEGQSRDRKGKIISVDIVNDAAHAKVEIISGNTKFTDYMLLLKLKDGWKIINKSYTREANN
ncbi:nuclear transport factor 2 family protein [Roseivirga sp.]|uniref:nuclear transport factor 2 family protein n=1 Tax=Roseivirga sp. TaxID=1964215 RepID=UPI003B8B600C